MGSRHRTSKYNQPGKVSDRYGQGDRRWSFLIRKKKGDDSPKTVINFRNVVVEEVSFYYGPPQIFYSCDCPDYQRAEEATPELIDQPDSQGRGGEPVIFPIENYSNYLSSYTRYQKGQALISEVEFTGTSGLGNVFNYRIPTSRTGKFDRDWSGSGAGIYPNWCKHIYAVAIYRGDDFVVPTDIPDQGDIPGIGDWYGDAQLL
ncbi:hypothetical protein K9N68_37115 (plasmid) [Kovacikia minuta CCNUW1]|uniref:SWIM zinc finger family protein n=1 Tax=Kovacikia minuta TaxID=2931930 RepID=UPI001CCAA28B|nr:SWIM zinc finger family protein [Kovacikia minuta]UBF29833.1 hypothetical protein K9N68_37115 [Kovacikia minuta CCNUW1]